MAFFSRGAGKGFLGILAMASRASGAYFSCLLEASSAYEAIHPLPPTRTVQSFLFFSIYHEASSISI